MMVLTRALVLIIGFLLTAPSMTVASGVSDPGTGDVTIDQDIDADETWGPTSSPYIISGDVRVMKGVRLTVLGGTIIRMGTGSSLVVEGELVLGEDNIRVNISHDGAHAPGNHGGIRFLNGSAAILESADISDASVAISFDRTTSAHVRNTTFSGNTLDMVLDNGSEVDLLNGSLDFSLVTVRDNLSKIDTTVYLSGLIVDHKGDPAPNIRLEARDLSGTLRLSYITNSTGEIPHLLFRGRTYGASGWEEENGTYHFSMSDDPFTHYVNMTRTVLGEGVQFMTFRWSWPPEILGLPASISVHEDRMLFLDVTLMDRNQAGHLHVDIDSPRVDFNESLSVFEFLYLDETVMNETVQIEVNDTYDVREYRLNVSLVPRDDPPILDLEAFFVTIREMVPYTVGIGIDDEDTPMDLIEVWSDHDGYVEFDRENYSLVLTFPDGTEEYFEINVTVSDGTTNVSSPLLVRFIDIKHPPEFVGELPSITVMEEQSATVDLASYFIDSDSLDVVRIFIDTGFSPIFSAVLNGTILTVDPIRNMHGTGQIQVTLIDNSSLSVTGYIQVSVLPVNDAPFLGSENVNPMGGNRYRFNVTYFDVDGDLPDHVRLVLDGTDHDMGLVEALGSDPISGMVFSISLDLEPGVHSFRFLASDSVLEHSLGNFSIEVPVEVILEFLGDADGSINITLRSIGDGPRPALVLIDQMPSPDPELYPAGCDFRISAEGRTLLSAVIKVRIGDYRSDLIGATVGLWYMSNGNWSEAGAPSYSIPLDTLTVEVSGEALNNSLHVFGLLDPEYDTDEDGVKNIHDAFPADPGEWNDTDVDQIGDNVDPDDDNDGFPDEVEMAAGTDPRNPRSFPLDSDGDGELDYLDEDDDGDGMPDTWERENGLDPLDPKDALYDPDSDGKSNLDEYRDGTDPFKGKEGNALDPKGAVLWIIVAVLLIVLIASVALFLFALIRRGRSDFDVEEAELEEALPEDWEVNEELDPKDASVCDGCSEIFPSKMSKCPFCGSISSHSYREE